MYEHSGPHSKDFMNESDFGGSVFFSKTGILEG